VIFGRFGDRRWFGTLIAAATLSFMAPAGAGAATTVGSTFDPAGSAIGCNPELFYVQHTSPGDLYRMPTSGVLTSWSFQTSTTAPSIRLKVLRSTGNPDQYLVVGESALKTLVPSQVNTFTDISIPVQAGDVLGMHLSGNGDCMDFTEAGYGSQSATTVNQPPGNTFTFSPLSNDDTRIPMTATLEPDCDGDGAGDESEDADTSSCNPQPQPEPLQPAPKADGTLTIDANKGKVEKGRKVTLTGQLDVPSNESCEPGRQIQIQRRLKSEDDSKFATFQAVQTDATGNYSLKIKVKKTYFYRAVLAENDVCDDETSNSQKVRVQKKKAAQEA
jgi:hypothetical protein